MNNNQLLTSQGYVVIPQVLSSNEVIEAREILTKIFGENSRYEGDINRTSEEGGSVYMDIFTRYKELRWLLFNRKLINGLSETLGKDFIFLPDAGMHDSQYGGWHKDTTSQEKHGHKFQYEEDFQVVTCAIYLQDNTPEYGGGLDIVPGSHLEEKDKFAVKPSILKKIENKVFHSKPPTEAHFPNKVTIPTKAGDMVVFNLKLTHKATHPTVLPVPLEHRKFSIFLICSVNNKHARNFTNYIKSRSDYYYLRNHKYPLELLEEAEKFEINLMKP